MKTAYKYTRRHGNRRNDLGRGPWGIPSTELLCGAEFLLLSLLGANVIRYKSGRV